MFVCLFKVLFLFGKTLFVDYKVKEIRLKNKREIEMKLWDQRVNINKTIAQDSPWIPEFRFSNCRYLLVQHWQQIYLFYQRVNHQKFYIGEFEQ